MLCSLLAFSRRAEVFRISSTVFAAGGEVRGLGLMLGVELVRNRQTKEPATTETAQVLELCKERGLLIGKGGFFGNTLRIKPPMCLTRDDADFLADCLDEVLGLI